MNTATEQSNETQEYGITEIEVVCRLKNKWSLMNVIFL